MTRQVDPITVACISGSLETILREMSIILHRTSWSPILKLARDYSHVILLPDCDIVAQGNDLPAHMGGMGIALRELVNYFGDDIHPGDIFYHNDPATGGTHIGDITLYRPIFCEDELIFWATSRAHMTDCGGPVPGSFNPNATEGYGEGLRITPVKIHEKGKERRDVLDFIVANIRFPHMLRADIKAQDAATAIAERRLLDMIEKYGKQTIKDCCKEILDIRERQVRAWISSLPDGVYEAKHQVEIPVRKLAEIEAKVTITGDELTVALYSPPQLDNYMNTYKAVAAAGVYMAVLKYSGAERPMNEGWFRPIKIDYGAEGKMLNATWPAPSQMATSAILGPLTEVVNLAMAQVVPFGKLCAGWHHAYTLFTSGVNPRNNERYSMLHFGGMAGGAGAVAGMDGWNAIGSEGGAGTVHRDSAERNEFEHPIRILRHELRMDSGGAGKWRGGQGCTYEFIPLGHSVDFAAGGSEMMLPMGIGGAKSTLIEPKVSSRWLHTRDGGREKVPNMMMGHMDAGDSMEIHASGGGGVGNPLERDMQAVLEDVINEKVSIEGARLDYGVIIEAQTLQIDLEETRKARGEEIK